MKRAFLAAALAGSLAGCGTRAPDALLPVSAQAVGATRVPILVATTRKALPGEPGLLFGGERSHHVSYRRIDVSIPPAHRVGEVEWPDSSPGDPARHFVTLRSDPLNDAGLHSSVREMVRRSGQRRVLVFVHGYNNQFDDAVFRFAQIKHDSRAPGVAVLFTWPSRGRLLAYPYDRESATYSRTALERLLTELSAEPAITDIDVLAHSMGNWVTLEALRQQAIRKGRVPAKIRNVMLAAPDIDLDVARTQVQDLGPNRPKITLFVAQDDRALAFSRLFWGSNVQLGAIDPEVEPYRSSLAKANITAVDLTRMRSGDPLHHATFAESPEVVRSIGARLVAGQTVGQDESLGEGIGLVVGGAARSLGAAATAAVSVPAAVVDPASRRNLEETFRAIVPGAHDPREDVATD
ncbi:alpha/beta hydrolase [Enterovirga aerilata]|uniref:Alpha/beta hydrolase n=1 Tax=Enterovirga aerilata TaxID=2730920 RepID=A0A849IDG4_9HYPH|nr:alpha/beta hydrolase [Enterovirga sp. DB1703]NNM74255.1 alpha/beta hydrolase [Enterovirga sp. DB1703]